MLPTLVPFWSPPQLRLSQYSPIVHDGSDFEVIPPVLLRPHLPTVGLIGESTEQLGTVDVVVAEDGRVEQVRLVRTNAERRFYDSMILAAVKSWRFRPASRSGQPVRYRVQITLS
jgi:TonB family protein